MAAFNIQRLTALPGVLTPSTLYITKNATNGSLVDLTFVGNEITEVRRALGQADVQTAVDAAIAALTADQIPNLPGTKITSAVPEATVAGKLKTAVKINDVSFDGSENITIPAEDTATPRLKVSDLGVTVASLVEGKVPLSQLPNGLDNLKEYATRADFPVTGQIETLYIAKDNNQMYRWSEGEPGDYIMIPQGGGTADTAVKLATPRQIALTGAVTGTTMFDGSANVNIAATLKPLVEADIPDLSGTKITSAVAEATHATNADNATESAAAVKLKTARTIALTGDVTGSGTFDGSGNLSIATIVAGGGVTGYTGTAIKVTYANGVAKTADTLEVADIPDLPGTKVTSAVAEATHAVNADKATTASALDVTAEW